MSSCCHSDTQPADKPASFWKSLDWMLWGSVAIVLLAFIGYEAAQENQVLQALWDGALYDFCSAITEYIGKMWWGIVAGFFFVGILGQIPREWVMSVLGPGNTLKGIFRATLAGFFFDLCSHGILMVSAKLYERGASLGQVMAFLITSPWNSFSLTLILITLIGLPWVLVFIALSFVVGLVAGVLFEQLVQRGVLPQNPNTQPLQAGYHPWREARRMLANQPWSCGYVLAKSKAILKTGVTESQMVLRWVMLSVVLVGVVRAVVHPEQFETLFGPTLAGLGLTLVTATLLEVCSEGSVPLAADIFSRASAPGNAFAFLMAGASTDYTEVLVMKETTRSWKAALFLPLLTVPQVLILAWVLNHFGA